ncbi:hypothetical protein GCM10011490_06870 [Pseudoclavibacter endophyticus]|uniref:Uncharacterized protein n=1 Tax=Pseudoclavibacter endophyticus TaxID=1778590 RepID=A0A6H9WLW8_9MICO|nr:hypothetical protein [Pseudoclavibacter endophyticus]KAB1649826.1 hypothetical protein F8O04_06250 [Pseudoclavibacter endophyticus]GGA59466.1 hypothetical protein GCM10011490_06870 [Pseudoclavibacter endophyticus]
MPVTLPAPWQFVGSVLAPDELHRLESIPGSSHIDDPRQWAVVRNDETGRTFLLRVQLGTEIAEVAGQTVPVRIVTSIVVPDADGREVTGSDLRSLPVKAISAELTRESVEYGMRKMSRWLRRRHHERNELPALDNRAGMTDDEFFAAVAEHWLNAHDAGDPSPVDRVVEASGASKRTAQRWAAEARRRGYIPISATGKSGRRPKRG